MSRTRKAILFLTISLLVTALASLADAWIARAVTDAGIPIQLKTWHLIAGRHVSIAEVLKFPGQYEATAIAAVLAILLCRKSPRWHAGVFVAVCALFSATNGLVKWMVGRARPFRELGDGPAITQLQPFHLEPFVNGFHGMTTSNLCFPSGHAALAMATAAGLAILFPRWRWAFYTIAAITSAERFLETAHWFSDTVAAAALGIGGAYLMYWLLESHLFAEQSTRELTAEQTS
jgi:membrane-associated phospholipid phosphatase